MNKKQILTCGAIIATFFSCNSNSAEKVKKINIDSIAQSKNEIKRLDSIRMSGELESAEARQDSLEETQIKGYSIKKLSGKLKYGGSNKMEYHSFLHVLAETEAASEKEMWTGAN